MDMVLLGIYGSIHGLVFSFQGGLSEPAPNGAIAERDAEFGVGKEIARNHRKAVL